eukprot:gene1541-1939_t
MLIFLVNIVEGQQYLHALYYDQDAGCGVLYKQQSFVVGQCYNFGYTSVKATYSGSTVYYGLTFATGCSGTTNNVQYTLGGGCSGNTGPLGFFRWYLSDVPILPTPGRVYYERYISGCGDNPMYITRVAMSTGVCITYGNEILGRTVANGVSSNAISMSVSCSGNTYAIFNAFTVPAATGLQISYSVNGYGLIQATVLGAWNLNTMLYRVSYYSGSSYTVLCTVVGWGGSCTGNVPNGITTNLQAVLLGTDYYGSPSPVPVISNNFQTPSLPTMLGLNVNSFTTKSVTFSYSSIGGLSGSNTYNVYVNNIKQDQCTTTTTCTVSSLPTGTQVSIRVSTSNSAPTVSSTQTPTTITLTYSSTGGIPTKTSYTVLLNNSPYATCSSTTSTTFIITNLTPYQDYYIQVSATNDDTTSTSPNTRYLLYNRVQNPVLEANVKSTSVELSFSSTDGYPGATTYRLTTTSCTITSLTPGTGYNFNVKASNSGDLGYNSINVFTYQAVSSPTISYSATYTQIIINYESTNGVPGLTRYTIQLNGSDYTLCTGISSTICTISSLTQGTSYNIKVTAINDGLVASNSVSASTYSYPTISALQVTSYTTSSITFTYSSDGGINGLVTLYTVQVNGVSYTSCSSITTCTVSGLTVGSTPSISVSATNSAITSPDKTTSQLLYSSVSVSSFSTSQSPTSITASYSSTTSCTVNNLTPYQTYDVQINAYNDGTSSQSTIKRILLFNPVQKPVLGATPKSTSIDLTFTSTDGYPGSTVYNVFNGAATVPSCQGLTTTTCMIPFLSPDTDYTFRVDAVNSGVTSSNPISSKTYKSISSLYLSYTATYTQILINYGSTNVVPGLTRFTIQLNGADYTSCTGISSTTCTISSLTSGTSYSIKMIAINDGLSVSTSLSASTYSYPTMTSLDIISFTTTSVKFSYSSNGGVFNEITTYNVQINGTPYPSCSSKTICTVTGLVPGSSALISVSASNYAITSPTSTIEQNLASSISVLFLRVSIGPSPGTSLQLDYSTSGGSGVTLFTISLNGTEIPACQSISTTKCIATGLTPLLSYTIQVVAINDGFTQTMSQNYYLWDKVQAPSVSSISTTKSITLQFSSIGGNPALTRYSVLQDDQLVQTCNLISTNTCTLSSLSAGTTYKIQVTASNFGYSNSTTNSFETFKIVSNPTMKVETIGYTQIGISYQTQNGVLGETLYTTQIDGISVPECFHIKETNCQINSLTDGSSYNVSVLAMNDGQTTSTSQLAKTYPYPVMNKLNLINFTSEAIYFNYTSSGGYQNVPNTYNVVVDGNVVTSCSSKNECSVKGLSPGKDIKISVSVSNSGKTSNPSSLDQILYNSLSVPSIDILSVTTTTINVGFYSKGGVPGLTKYIVKLDSNVLEYCNMISNANTCLISNLNPGQKYTITVNGLNDIDTTSNSTDIITIPKINNPQIKVMELTSDFISIQIGYSGGVGSTSTKVFIDSNEVSSSILENDGSIVNTLKTFKTYSIISEPTITAIQTPTDLIISTNSIGGTPSYPTTFDILINNTILCKNITSTDKCRVEGITFRVYYKIDVNAFNYKTKKNTFNLVKTFAPPTKVIISGKSELSNITLSWTESNEGKPNETKYLASISYDGTIWKEVCTNTITVYNSFFEPVHTHFNLSTLDLPNNCIPKGSTNECSNHGTCVNGQCECDSDYDGHYCESPIKPFPPIIIPDPTRPGANVSQNGVKYTFELCAISEVDISRNIIKIIELRNLNWTLNSSDNETVIHPLSNEKFIKIEWKYSTIPSGEYSDIAKAINITFIQYNKIQGVTLGESFHYGFAGQNYSIRTGSLKYTMKVDNWNFNSNLHKLELNSSVSAPVGSGCGSNRFSFSESNDDITSVNVHDDNGNYVFGRILNRAILDNIPRSISQIFTSDTKNEKITITSQIPYFLSHVILDPDFHLILSVNGKSKECGKSLNWRLITGVTVGGVALICIVIGAGLLVKKKMNYIKAKKSLNNRLAQNN